MCVCMCVHISEQVCTCDCVIGTRVFWDQGLCSGLAKFEMLARHPRGYVNKPSEICTLSSEK